MSTEDTARSGRPKEDCADKNIKKVRKIILDGRKVKFIEIPETLKKSKERVRHILNGYLGMRKLCAWWVSRELTIVQTHERIDDSELFLKLFNRNRSEFLRRYVSIDETWLYHFTLESNRQSAEWSGHDESNQKRGKTQRPDGKVTTAVFSGVHDIIFIDYLEKRKTINR